MDPVTSLVKSIDVPLGSSRQTLRVSAMDGVVVLAVGFGGAQTGDPFLRPHWGEGPITVPARIVPQLRDALNALQCEP